MTYIDYLNTIIVAIIIPLVGFIIGKLVEKIVHKVVKEIEISVLVQNATSLRVSFEQILGNILKWIIFAIGIVTSLRYLAIENIVLTIVIIVFAVVGIISLLLSINDWIPNGIAGCKLKKLTGKNITLGTLSGVVIEQRLTHILLKTKGGDQFRIPNTTLALYTL